MLGIVWMERSCVRPIDTGFRYVQKERQQCAHLLRYELRRYRFKLNSPSTYFRASMPIPSASRAGPHPLLAFAPPPQLGLLKLNIPPEIAFAPLALAEPEDCQSLALRTRKACR